MIALLMDHLSLFVLLNGSLKDLFFFGELSLFFVQIEVGMVPL